jgi:hypothetical protein
VRHPARFSGSDVEYARALVTHCDNRTILNTHEEIEENYRDSRIKPLNNLELGDEAGRTAWG